MSFIGNWPLGTIAVNRYASGWIHPDQVQVHHESSGAYSLSPCCDSGVQLLALLPASGSGQTADLNRQWWHLDVRDPEDYWERGLADAGVGEEIGVAVHWIDQHVGSGASRRQAQVGGRVEDWNRNIVHPAQLSTAGSEFCLHPAEPTWFVDCSGPHQWRIQVTASQNRSLNLTVIEG